METKQFYEEFIPNHLRVFLDEKGLSNTEANHKANLITEAVKVLDADFANTGAYNSVVDFKGKNVNLTTNRKLEDLIASVEAIGNYHALSAWFREGIKAKNSALDLIKRSAGQTLYSQTVDGEYPTFNEKQPVQPSFLVAEKIDANTVIGEMSIAQRSDYFSLEAKAAAIGVKIHKSGIISDMRNERLKDKSTEFKSLPSGEGVESYVVTFTPVYSKAELELAFHKLQQLHRSYESKLNYYKANIENAVTERTAKANQELADKSRAAQEVYANDLMDYNTKWKKHQGLVSTISLTLEKRKLDLIRYISGLKIIIPHEFQVLSDSLK